MLCKIADGGPNGGQVVLESEYHVSPIIRNNYGESTHDNGLWISYTKDALVTRNWGRDRSTASSTGVGPSLQIGASKGLRATVTNNVSHRTQITSGAGWTVSGNVTSDRTSPPPPGWIEMRRGNSGLAVGAPFTGQYGAVGVTPPTPPAALTTGQVAFGAVAQDPALLSTNPKRTFTITVPAGSPARDAFEMRWSSDADAVIRNMTRLADASGNQVYRAGSNDSLHLRNPGETWTNGRIYYRITSGGTLSLPSTYTFTQTVPTAPYGVPTNRIDTTTLSRMRFAGHEITAFRYGGVTLWTKASAFAATGGTVTTSGGYKYHTFTSTGTLTVTLGTRSDVEMLLVGGGASGGSFRAGGGGAGEVRTFTTRTLSPGDYSIIVGAGGATVSSGVGNSGGDSSALGLTSTGGGGGARKAPPARPAAAAALVGL
jgi:hypothetical protein